MKNVDKILGLRIQNIEVLTNRINEDFLGVELVLIEFGHYKLAISLNADYDEINAVITSDFKLADETRDMGNIDLLITDEISLRDLYNKKLIWIWTLTNNQGYIDGLQIEVENGHTIQFMVKASSIYMKRLTEINILCR